VRVYYLQIRGNSLAPASVRNNPSQRLVHGRAEAQQKLHNAIRILDELAGDDLANPTYAHMLGLLYLEAASFDRQDDPAAAADYLDQATTIFETLGESHNDNPEYGIALCSALSAGNPRDRGLNNQELDAFAERLNRALRRVEALVESHPQVPNYRGLQAVLHHKLGTVLMRLGFDKEAEASYAATIDFYRTLASRFPDAADYYKLRGAFARQSLAGLLLERDDRQSSERARDELLTGIATAETIVTKGDDQVTVNLRVGDCYRLLANAYRQLGEDELAAEALRQSLSFGLPRQP
jgi:tetratricopeptide (TPR) repeat protein